MPRSHVQPYACEVDTSVVAYSSQNNFAIVGAMDLILAFSFFFLFDVLSILKLLRSHRSLGIVAIAYDVSLVLPIKS